MVVVNMAELYVTLTREMVAEIIKEYLKNNGGHNFDYKISSQDVNVTIIPMPLTNN